MEFWGFKRVMGPCFTVLYLTASRSAPRASSRWPLQGRLPRTPGDLERWGVVEALAQAGDRLE